MHGQRMQSGSSNNSTLKRIEVQPEIKPVLINEVDVIVLYNDAIFFTVDNVVGNFWQHWCLLYCSIYLTIVSLCKHKAFS